MENINQLHSELIPQIDTLFCLEKSIKNCLIDAKSVLISKLVSLIFPRELTPITFLVPGMKAGPPESPKPKATTSLVIKSKPESLIILAFPTLKIPSFPPPPPICVAPKPAKVTILPILADPPIFAGLIGISLFTNPKATSRLICGKPGALVNLAEKFTPLILNLEICPVCPQWAAVKITLGPMIVAVQAEFDVIILTTSGNSPTFAGLPPIKLRFDSVSLPQEARNNNEKNTHSFMSSSFVRFSGTFLIERTSMIKDTMEIVVAAETLAESFEESIKDGNLSVWDLWNFSDDFDELEAAYKDSSKIYDEAANASPEELKEVIGRLGAAFIKIAKCLKKS